MKKKNRSRNKRNRWHIEQEGDRKQLKKSVQHAQYSTCLLVSLPFPASLAFSSPLCMSLATMNSALASIKRWTPYTNQIMNVHIKIQAMWIVHVNRKKYRYTYIHINTNSDITITINMYVKYCHIISRVSIAVNNHTVKTQYR